MKLRKARIEDAALIERNFPGENLLTSNVDACRNIRDYVVTAGSRVGRLAVENDGWGVVSISEDTTGNGVVSAEMISTFLIQEASQLGLSGVRHGDDETSLSPALSSEGVGEGRHRYLAASDPSDAFSVRHARFGEVDAIHEMIAYYARREEVLPKSRDFIFDHLRDYVVAVKPDGRIAGCAALQIVNARLAELCSLCVAPGFQGRGKGQALIRGLLHEAECLGLLHVFALTRQVPLFRKTDFDVVPREMLPQKIWKDCMGCPRYDACDEVAMLRHIPARATEHAGDG